MLQFRPIASSSSGCCYHVSGGGTRGGLLIDAGLRMQQIDVALRFQVTSLAGCLISHGHGDHAKAVPDLQRMGVDCYASAETWGDFRWGKLVPYRCHAVEAEKEFSVGDWRVMPCLAVHDEPGTLGFLIGSPEGDRLLYLTDSAYAINRFEGLTQIAIECNHSEALILQNAQSGRIDRTRARRTFSTHMSLERLIPMLLANDLSRCEEIWLLHLSRENSDAEAFRRAVQEATGIPTYVAAA